MPSRSPSLAHEWFSMAENGLPLLLPLQLGTIYILRPQLGFLTPLFCIWYSIEFTQPPLLHLPLR